MRRNKVIFFVLVLLSSGLMAFKFLNAKQQAVPAHIVVVRSDISDVVQASGVLSPYRKVEVGAQVTGQVLQLNVELGQDVKKGELLARIDPTIARNDLQVREGTLEQLRAGFDAKKIDLIASERELTRQVVMSKTDSTTQFALEAAQTLVDRNKADLRGLAAQVKQAQIQIDSNKTLLSYTEILAPINGNVIGIAVQEGQTVNAVQAIPTVLTLAQLDMMTIRAKVPEADITRVHKGQSVQFSTLGNDKKKYKSTVRAIQPLPERINNAVFYNVLFDIENSDRYLWPDMTVEASFFVNVKKNILTLPWSAIGQQLRGGNYSVMILVNDGTFLKREVHLGIDDKINVEIVSGLQENDRVILNNSEYKP